MNEKLSFQNIVDVLAQKSGVSKKVADTFAKAFFDTIVEALYMGEESIKVKGLGTFRLVQVESRESVNVSNGERIVIPGYKKVSFSPEDSVVEFLNGKKDAEKAEDVDVAVPVSELPEKEENESKEEVPAVEVLPEEENSSKEEGSAVEVLPEEEAVPAVDEAPALNEEPIVEEMDTLEALIQVPEPTNVEEPLDAFAGIDMLISTPESLEEVRQQYEEAKAKMDAAVEEARKANAEKARLEKLLERLEQNAVPEGMPDEGTEMAAEATPAEGEGKETESTENPIKSTENQIERPASEDDLNGANSEEAETESNGEERRKAAFERVMNDGNNTASGANVEAIVQQEKREKKVRRFWLVAALSLLLAAIVFFLYKTFRNIEAVEHVPVAEKPVKQTPSAKPAPAVKPASAVGKDSVKKVAQKDTLKSVPETNKEPDKKEQQPARPSTHRMQRGESLTRISQKYYGTKDSVRAILRINTFNDPDNIPVGAVVRLP